MSRFKTMLSALVFSTGGFLQSAPVDLSRPVPVVGYADSSGMPYYSIPFSTLKLSERVDDALPIHIDFSVGRENSEVIGAEGWGIPVLDSRAELLPGGGAVAVFLPCGKSAILSKVAEEKYATSDGKWSVFEKGSLLEMSREDGWKLSFSEHGLTRIVTDSGKEWTWVRDEQGRTVEVRDFAKRVVLAASWNGGTIKTLKLGKTVAGFETDSSGAVEFEVSHGSDFHVRYRIISVKNGSELQRDGDSLVSFSWNEKTRVIESDGLNSYQVAVAPGEPIEISMVNPLKQVTTVVTHEGRTRSVRSGSGDLFEYTYFENEGLASRLKAATIESGSGDRVLYYSAELDERKRLARVRIRLSDVEVRPFDIPAVYDPNRVQEVGMQLTGTGEGVTPCVIEYLYENGGDGRHLGTESDGRRVLSISYDDVGHCVRTEIVGRFGIEEWFAERILKRRVILAPMNSDDGRRDNGVHEVEFREVMVEEFENGGLSAISSWQGGEMKRTVVSGVESVQ